MKLLTLINGYWAIHPKRFVEIRDVLCDARFEAIELAEFEARQGMAVVPQSPPYVLDGIGADGRGTAVVNIDGIITKTPSFLSRLFGGQGTRDIARNVRAAFTDPNSHSVALAIDSPGGEVDGTQELARIIRESRGGEKPLVALADGMMASAAYWIGSGADAVYALDDTTQVGSIGVVTTHFDVTKMLDNIGVKPTVLTAGKYKAVGSPFEKLETEGRDMILDELNQIYSVFVNDVAANRGTTPEDVLDRMANGRIFIGDRAREAGLIDGVATREQVFTKLAMVAEARREMRGLGAAAAERLRELQLSI